MPPDPYAAVLRLEDKLAAWADEQRRTTGEVHRLVAELTSRQAVLEERLTTTQSDVTRARDSVAAAHRRVDQLVEAQAREVGQRTGAERARRRFFQTSAGVTAVVGTVVALGQFGLGILGG
jgi:Flp pilus assembly protein TadB